MYSYVTKFDLKIAADVDASNSVKNVDLASLKSEIDKLGIGKLETTAVDVVKNKVVKKTGYN